MTNGPVSQNGRLRNRLEQVEATLGLHKPAFETRLESIENKIEELGILNPPSPWPSRFDMLIKFLQTITPVVLLVLGFSIQGSVDQAIKKREIVIKEARLTLDEAKEVESLLKELHAGNHGKEDAKRIVQLIARYGDAGIRPLFLELNADRNTSYSANASIESIKVHAVMSDDRQPVCVKLGLISAMEPPIFNVHGLKRVADLSKAIGCGKL